MIYQDRTPKMVQLYKDGRKSPFLYSVDAEDWRRLGWSDSPSTPPLAQSETASADENSIPVNSVTLEELEDLKGIGQIIAAKIVAARPFTSLEDAKKVFPDKFHSQMRLD